ncbi:MAG: sigma 54-interacting transcriptional regulator [Spirochaetaceae bacterium]|jgi:Nif-specific regulatory protein|nr:sigma 54-interacting transcriptional regulator [Spirochaetaceae bacterium]
MTKSAEKLDLDKHNLEPLNLVAEISRIILGDKNIQNNLHQVLHLINDSLPCVRSMISIFNRKTGKIYLKDGCGVDPQNRDRAVYLLGEGITGRVVESGQEMLIPDISQDKRFLNRTGYSMHDGQVLSFICIPVKSGLGTIGALSAFFEDLSPKELQQKNVMLKICASILYHAVQHYQNLEEEMDQLRSENFSLHERLEDNRHISDKLKGNSKVMQRLYQMVEKIATSDATLLILGESGVGKGLVAQCIHELSGRKDSPFIKLNCASLPESIIESELFGHERGAFTGAMNRRIGRFEQAKDGSIFLDEIGEVSLGVQAKLLRVLQEREFERVGGSETLFTHARIIAATNRDLETMVKQGTFREDLYYRLNIIPIPVPPLRQRKADIILLAEHFIEKYNNQNTKQINRLSTPAIDMLTAYHWPGNVRELENAIERAVILSDDISIHGYHLPPSLQMAEYPLPEKNQEGTLEQRLDALEYEMIVEALKCTRGNLLKASQMLGLTNRMMGIRAKKYHIDYRVYRKI